MATTGCGGGESTEQIDAGGETEPGSVWVDHVLEMAVIDRGLGPCPATALYLSGHLSVAWHMCTLLVKCVNTMHLPDTRPAQPA